jgi:hypothetical protein
MPIDLPRPPIYRRWSVILAGVIALAAIMAGLGWRGLQEVASPNPTSTTVPAATTTTLAEHDPATSEPSSFGATSKPDHVLWGQRGSPTGMGRSQGFRAPSVWRIEWSFDCSNFRKLGGGNFKITGNGAFARIQIQEFDVKASGSRTFTSGGYGHLVIDSVCKRWTVKAVPA